MNIITRRFTATPNTNRLNIVLNGVSAEISGLPSFGTINDVIIHKKKTMCFFLRKTNILCN